MNRFRKKSDAKRTHIPPSQNLDPQETLPELPLPDDFRTSLILPDLSRRFSLLRSATGDPLSIEHLKTRLANQRARGAPNQISEEEEDMLLETLGRMRSKGTPSPSPGASQEYVVEGEDGARDSMATSSVTSSPSRSTKRYSNQLFGSGRLRDYSYLKTVASSRASRTSARTISLTSTANSTRESGNTGPRPVTPEGETSVFSVQTSPHDKMAIPPRSASLVPHTPPEEETGEPISSAEYRLQMALGPNVLKRASMALQEAIKEMEDEVEDEILLPRSTPIPRGNIDHTSHTPEMRNSYASIYEAGMAISIDKTIHDEFSERRASPIPARTVPGYVPGMPRPMTPRDIDIDEQRSHSTTPRAQSPYVDLPGSSTPLNISTTKLRRESISSSAKPTPTTPVSAAPLFLQRSTNGRYTPDDSHRFGNSDSVELGDNQHSSLVGRRRPASPLSSPPYQPMAVSGTRPPSRPTTPSNVIWNPNLNQSHKSNYSSHSRNDSWTTDGGLSSADHSGSFNGLHKFGPRPLRSPSITERPDFSQTPPQSSSFGSSISNGRPGASDGPHAYIPDMDFGTPILASTLVSRSDTPTQNAQRSPISPTFANFDLSSRHAGSKRTSRQNPPSSPFNLNTPPSLGFSPRANSSRSSLDSVGSSFHSWDETDKVFALFSDSKEQQPSVWHEFEDDHSSSVPPEDGSPDEEEWDAEEIIQRYAGLKKADIAVIQEKLVTAAFVKIANTDPRDRAPSAMRRARRPSTSQSNYSRIASPPPQLQPPSSPSYVVDDQYSKASALLNSVVDSIKDHPPVLNTSPSTPEVSSEEKDLSPNTRRNRDLAHVLFGTDDDVNQDEDTIRFKPEPSAEPEFIATHTNVQTNNIVLSPPVLESQSPPALAPAPVPTRPAPSSTFITPYLLRNPSMPRIPQTPQEEADLTREVQQKADAAMLALNKNPSHVNLGDGLKHSPSMRRRVDPSQISTPKLVSTTTVVETVPIRSPSLSSNNTGSSKLGSRFKKLRGSLRAKNIVSSGEETVVPDTTKSPSSSQTAYYDANKLNPPGAPKLSSATESGRFKVPVPSPPASAGPGLKGFMARFRNKQRMSEMPSGSEPSTARATSPLSPAISPLSPRFAEPTTPTTPKQAGSPTDRSLSPRAPGQPRPMYSRFPPANPPAASPAASQLHAEPTVLDASQSAAALEQLFKAANNLGLDQNALSDLLARSGSTSRPHVSRNVSATASSTSQVARKGSDNIQQISYVGSTGSDQTATPTNSTSLSSEQEKKATVADARPVTPEESVSRKLSVRKHDHLRRPKEGQNDTVVNPVVRRTIIYANDVGAAGDLSALIQRKNSARRRRASATSVSARSVHDRAPTPPPSKTPTAKRFSADGMPPMPQMPNILGQADKMLNVPSTSASGLIEKSNSTYDSLYDMYSGDSRVASVVATDPHAHADQPSKGETLHAFETGPALEFIEMANGETVWSVVNGLRDGDDESIYSGRTSFASEYSSREPGTDGLLQSFVKEHSRTGSKGSAASVISKKRPLQQQGKTRPETKVFYSSSAQIGRLIESLSQGADAGSFNFLPNLPPSHGPGHSASSSLSTNDINWTVEERLDRMLGAMATP